MSEIFVAPKRQYSVTQKISDTYKETEYINTLEKRYQWNTIASGSIPFTIINIAYISEIDPITGNMKTNLTGKDISDTYKEINITNVGQNGYKFECTGGIIRFIGIIDGNNVDIIISAGNGIEFSNSINGKVYASVDPTTIGQFSYDRYTCASLYGGYAVKSLIEIDEIEYRPPSPEPDPDPEPTPDPEPATLPTLSDIFYNPLANSIDMSFENYTEELSVYINNIRGFLDYYKKIIDPEPDPEPEPTPDPEPEPGDDADPVDNGDDTE